MNRKKTFVLTACALVAAVFLMRFTIGQWSLRNNNSNSVITSAEPEGKDEHRSEQPEDINEETEQSSLRQQTFQGYSERQPMSVAQDSGDSCDIAERPSEFGGNQPTATTEVDSNSPLPYTSPDTDDKSITSDNNTDDQETVSDSSADIDKEKLEILYNRSKAIEEQLNDLYSGLYLMKIGMHSLAESCNRLLQGIDSDKPRDGDNDIANISNNENNLENIKTAIQQISQSLKTMSGENGIERLQSLIMKIQDVNDKNIKDLEEMLKERDKN